MSKRDNWQVFHSYQSNCTTFCVLVGVDEPLIYFSFCAATAIVILRSSFASSISAYVGNVQLFYFHTLPVTLINTLDINSFDVFRFGRGNFYARRKIIDKFMHFCFIDFNR